MRKKMKALWALALALLIGLCLGGCDIPMPGFADYDVSGYIQALLDSSYKGSHESFITVARASSEAAVENHTTTVENAAIHFCNTYGVSPGEAEMDQLEEVFSQLLTQAQYTVREEQKVDTGYYIEIEVTPITNFADCSAQLEALRAQAQEEASAANAPSPTPSPDPQEDGDGWNDWSEEGGEDEDESPIATPVPTTTRVDPNELYIQKVVDFCRQQSQGGASFGVARTMSLDIRQTAEGALQLDLNQIDTLDQTVLQFTVG